MAHKSELEYQWFRKKVGELAVRAGQNPYEILIQYLEVTLEDEKKRYEKAKGGVNELAATIAKALGCDIGELTSGAIPFTPDNLKKVVDALSENSDDDEEDDEEDDD
jgi:hypothetical protein